MKIQLKRSNVLEGGKAKKPTAAQLEYGEIAINYNADDPTLFIKDSNNAVIALNSTGLPNLDDNNQQPGTIDDRYVNVNGDTMTGSLILNADPTNDLGAVTKQYVDNLDIPAAPDASQYPPADPTNGQLWWNINDGRLYIYYQDVDSAQWVPATPETSSGIQDDWSAIPSLP